MMGFGMLWMAVFWIGLVLVGVWLARNYWSAQGGGPGLPVSPLEIAKRRYARGEISKEEFEELKHDLA